MKILILDIETSPNTAHIWGLFNQNVSIKQLMDSSYTMCWSAKWLDSDEIEFESLYRSSNKNMIGRIHELLDEADAVIHYNGKKFDIPTLNKEFLLLGMHPPTPYKQIDLFQVVRSTFRFPSMKLDYVLRALNIERKVEHEGHNLWVRCMAGEEQAWKEMEAYNIGDVLPLEKLYKLLRPWIKNHPNYSLYCDTDRPLCTNCGSDRVISKGVEKTKTQEYRRFKCNDCGCNLRGRFNQTDKDKKQNILIQV